MRAEFPAAESSGLKAKSFSAVPPSQSSFLEMPLMPWFVLQNSLARLFLQKH